jgi:hypothetical protein
VITPPDQSNRAADLELTSRRRQALVADESLFALPALLRTALPAR